MTVSVTTVGFESFAVGSGYFFPAPAAGPLQVPLTGSVAGDWLIAVITWRQQQSGQGVSVAVADDAHNWWEPLGAPATDGTANCTVRTAIWAAPAARAAAFVQIAPTGPYISLCAVIFDVSGMAPWMVPAGYGTAAVTSGTSVSVPLAAPPAQVLALAAVGSDNLNFAITGPGAGWSAQSIVTASNGTDHTSDLQLTAAWQVTSGAVTAAWSSAGTQDLQAAAGSVQAAAAAPAQPNPVWPVVITEIAPGGGAQTPPAQLSWTALSPRALALSIQQGRQYTLSQLQAGQGTLMLDNPDGALIPPGTGSFAGIDSGTPVRQRVIWTGGAWQVQFTGTGSVAAPQIDTGQIFAVTPGVTYTASAWLGTSVPWASGMKLTLQYRTSGGTLLSSFTSAATNGPTAVLATASGAAPATAAKANVIIGASGTPPASVVFSAAAAPPAAGYLAIPPAVAWISENSAIVTTLAPWAEDPRGAPVISPNYVTYNGYFKRWPWAMDSQLYRGKTEAEITDIWGYANGVLSSIAIEECLLDNPYALWPMTDPPGSQGASNVAAGNANPLTLTLSKNGAGGSVITWGANSAALIGMSSAKVTASGASGGGAGMFEQVLTGTSLNTNGYGYALTCFDANYPPVSGGVTIETWFANTTDQSTNGVPVFTATTTGNQFNTAGSNFANGTPVVLAVAPGFSLPGGFSAGTIYFVVNSSGGNYQLSASPGGVVITVTSGGAGFIIGTTAWGPVVASARNIHGPVAEVWISVASGNLMLRYTAGGTVSTAVIDSATDYRTAFRLFHVSLAFNRTTWRALVDGGSTATASGTFSGGQIASSFGELHFGGVMDRATQGFGFSGFLALAGVYPVMLPQVRVISHQTAGQFGLAGDAACDRVERILEYAGIAGRRWLGQQRITFFGDLAPSGQDIGGQAAASSASNIASSTLPALLYVAPTGDAVYWSKLYTWNQPVKWTLGDSTAAGEIPFLPGQLATDYDPSRVENDIQLTQLDTQAVTVPSGITSATTMQAVEAASQAQYGDSPYQQTGYLEIDYSSDYNAGGGLADLANWIANIYAKPKNRIQAVTVEAASHPSAWPFWSGASTGDMVAVNVRPPTAAASPLISLIARITQTTRRMQFSQEGTSAQITAVLDFAPEYQALICDDPVRGLLNGQNVLPW